MYPVTGGTASSESGTLTGGTADSAQITVTPDKNAEKNHGDCHRNKTL